MVWSPCALNVPVQWHFNAKPPIFAPWVVTYGRLRCIVKQNIHIACSGLLIFRGKKSQISRDFQGQIRGKIGWFRGIFAGKKSKFAAKSADFAGFSRDFRGRKVKIRRKIGRFRGILAEKSQISKDFRGQILRKSGGFHGKFQGETSPRNNL